jgi:hypothetical protein
VKNKAAWGRYLSTGYPDSDLAKIKNQLIHLSSLHWNRPNLLLDKLSIFVDFLCYENNCRVQ